MSWNWSRARISRRTGTGDVTGGTLGLGRTYDVSPDGLRFLMLKAPGTDASAAPTALIVVQQWDEELKRLVPAGT